MLTYGLEPMTCPTRPPPPACCAPISSSAAAVRPVFDWGWHPRWARYVGKFEFYFLFSFPSFLQPSTSRGPRWARTRTLAVRAATGHAPADGSGSWVLVLARTSSNVAGQSGPWEGVASTTTT